MKLTTERAIIEQLALGNKCQSIEYQVTINVPKKSKKERICAEFAHPMMAMVDDDLTYLSEAEEWVSWYKKNRGTLVIIGRAGQVATLPMSRKDKDLPDILRAFSR